MKPNTKMYEQIREALIALLCIGDKVNYIHYNHLGSPDYIVRRYPIIEIEEKDITIQIEGWNEICRLSAIEHYQGQLYILEEPQVSREQKIKEMIEILESETTDFEKDERL